MINEVYEKQRELESQFKELEDRINFLGDRAVQIAEASKQAITIFQEKHRVADERIAYLEKKIEQLVRIVNKDILRYLGTDAEACAKEFCKARGDKDAKATDVET